MKRIVPFLCVGSLLVFLFPVKIYAEDEPTPSPEPTATYGILEAGCYYVGKNSGNSLSAYLSVSTDVRAVWIGYGSTQASLVCISDAPFNYTNSNSNSCPTASTAASQVNGHPGYYVAAAQNKKNINELGIPGVSWTNGSASVYGPYVWELTYGDGAVGPGPVINWGDLLDVKFNTSIAGSGSAATNNIDNITWDPVQDSNGNALSSEQRVEIKAIAGNYTATSRNGLFGLGATDFDYNSGIEHVIGNVAANRGEFHISWSEVIRQLNSGSISDFLNIRKSDDVWLKSGWIYQYRFLADDYTGEWHTIYTGTSAGVQNSLNIEQSTQINTNLVNTIIQINTLNNSEQENWMINNTVINMENSDGQETTDKPWWAYLLEAIVSLIDGVLTFLGNLIGDLISAIIDLFTFDSFDLDVIVDFGTEQRESNNIIGQSINFFDNVVQSAQSMRESDVIISYPGITLFDVELLPAANYNLNEYVEDLGLTDFHNLAYLVTDGSIAICLISLVYRKIMGILRS